MMKKNVVDDNPSSYYDQLVRDADKAQALAEADRRWQAENNDEKVAEADTPPKEKQ